MDSRPRTWTRVTTWSFAVLLGALALVLAGCPEAVEDEPAVEDDTAVDEPEHTPVDAPAVDEGTDLALDATCVNDEVGYEIDHPADWDVNSADALPACSAFDPVDASMPNAGEIPLDVAVVLREEPVAFDDATDLDGDPGVDEVSRGPTSVDGRDAVAIELEHTGEGLYEAGLVTYAYYVGLDGSTLIASTHDVAEAQPSFVERRDLLDAMVDSLTFSRGDIGAGDVA